MSKARLFNWLNRRSNQAQMLDRRRALFSHALERTLWSETPNDYREKNLGLMSIAGQRVRAKRVYETKNLKGPNWLVLDPSFRVSP